MSGILNPINAVTANDFPVAAGQNAVVLGATGGKGDWLSHILIVPTSTAPGAVSYQDGSGTPRVIFAGGTVPTPASFAVPIGLQSNTAAGWKVTTGSNVAIVAYGSFT
jgi:hypothetical protein